jgi:heparanase 1
MSIKPRNTTSILPAFLAAILSVGPVGAQSIERVKLSAPSSLPKVTTVDRRFQSYNIEMAEVTGGRFWKPYSPSPSSSAKPNEKGVGISLSSDTFQYRPPIDLTNRRLRNLAQALGPAYVRVSGAWQNGTYFHDSDSPAPSKPPSGFAGVLTRPQWKGVVDFAKAVDAQIMTSVATSVGTRDSEGVWTPKQAEQFFAYTKSIGGEIAAAQFMNEPTLALRSGVPDGYSAAAYGRDNQVFLEWLRQTYPKTTFVGPGGEGEGMGWKQPAMMQRIPSEELLRATGPVFDVYSYHFYNAISSRCSGFLGGGTSPEKALTADFLDIPERVNAFYTGLRDRYVPGKPTWVTETGQAACGGDRWASTFIDAFRYLNELGTLAKQGVQVVFHNTLAASDYALLDEDTFSPRPDYWAALLWHRLMGATVLDAGPAADPQVRLYAHCLPDKDGGVTLLAINASDRAITLDSDTSGESYVLSAPELETKNISLNGRTLSLDAHDAIPRIVGKRVKGEFKLSPRAIAFLAFRDANNPVCKQDLH